MRAHAFINIARYVCLQLIDVETMDFSLDTMFPNPEACPLLSKMEERMQRSAPYKEFIRNTTEGLMVDIAQVYIYTYIYVHTLLFVYVCSYVDTINNIH